MQQVAWGITACSSWSPDTDTKTELQVKMPRANLRVEDMSLITVEPGLDDVESQFVVSIKFQTSHSASKLSAIKFSILVG